MLPAWNVPSTCLPIEQELAEQCRLLLLALRIGWTTVKRAVDLRRSIKGSFNNCLNIS